MIFYFPRGVGNDPIIEWVDWFLHSTINIYVCGRGGGFPTKGKHRTENKGHHPGARVIYWSKRGGFKDILCKFDGSHCFANIFGRIGWYCCCWLWLLPWGKWRRWKGWLHQAVTNLSSQIRNIAKIAKLPQLQVFQVFQVFQDCEICKIWSTPIILVWNNESMLRLRTSLKLPFEGVL